MVFTVCINAVAPLYSLPDKGLSQADELLFGDCADILEEEKGFYKVITEYGYIGWVKKQALCKSLPTPTHFVSSRFADLLPQKSFLNTSGVTLPHGARVCAGQSDARYAQIELGKSKFYLHKSHLTPISYPKTERDFRESVVKTAFKYIGVQYRWGGRSCAGVDCSGLCFNSYRLNGVNIWRDAVIERSQNLRKIGFNNAKRGDLLFFKGHIALYLGNGNIIHSSATAGKVVAEKFTDSKILKEIYICAGTLF